MFKPSPTLLAARRRLRLTTKQTNGGYYKGNRTGSMGRHTKHGNYVIEWQKVRTYVVPADLDRCKLSPFVTQVMEPTRGNFQGDGKGPLSGARFLDAWKEKNGVD